MKNAVHEIVTKALKKAIDAGDLPELTTIPKFTIERPRESKFGDFSTNAALILTPILSMKPRDIATKLTDHITENSHSIEKVEIAGPGFINFFATDRFWQDGLKEILQLGKDFGKTEYGNGEKVLVEFVSANPTGPLHVGHGRGAVVGDVMANILAHAGYNVEKEYYINDVGLQMQTLGLSTFIRYKQLFGKAIELPENSYQGDYIKDIAEEVKQTHGDTYLSKSEEEAVPFFSKFSEEVILQNIREDLNKFVVKFDNWYSEATLHQPLKESGKSKVETIIEWMVEKGFVYEKDDALWFKTTAFSDDKDRVVKRGSGIYTYFASDIAYHKDKLERGFKKIINVLGADHHGYVPRLQSVIKALGYEEDPLKVILIQLVNLKKGNEVISMSTRSGKFTRLSELVNDVGSDATRFFYLTRSYDAQFDFDIDLAKSQSSENPVFYVQYAHARICSIFRQAEEKGISFDLDNHSNISLLTQAEELQLIKKLLSLPEIIDRMASKLEVHLLTHFLHDIVSDFHSYYSKHRIISEEEQLTQARLALIHGIRLAISNSLSILGVTSPEKM